MGWGDLPTWVGCAAAIAAAIYAAKSSRAADRSLELQRSAIAPAVEWTLERDDPKRQWGVFYLRNSGSLDAAAVTVVSPAELTAQLDGVDVAAKAAHPLVIVVGVGARPITQLMLKWQGQDQPVAVPVPPMTS